MTSVDLVGISYRLLKAAVDSFPTNAYEPCSTTSPRIPYAKSLVPRDVVKGGALVDYKIKSRKMLVDKEKDLKEILALIESGTYPTTQRNLDLSVPMA